MALEMVVTGDDERFDITRVTWFLLEEEDLLQLYTSFPAVNLPN